jgi:ABC-type polysaccharide/polyol phosphate export permease
MPCGPLTALLAEIALMSKTGLEGLIYAAAFGMGTFFSGLITIGAAAGLLHKIPAQMLKSPNVIFLFRLITCLMLVIFGVGLVLAAYYAGS